MGVVVGSLKIMILSIIEVLSAFLGLLNQCFTLYLDLLCSSNLCRAIAVKVVSSIARSSRRR